MAKIVILGAGLTGLSVAYHLEKNNFFNFMLFEKEDTYGGLSRSVSHEGFTFDYTGHLLHCNDPYFYQVLTSLLPESDRLSINRNSFIYKNNVFGPYPFQLNLQNYPPNVILECIIGFAKRKHGIKEPKTFHDWVLKHFGSGIAKHFFFPFNEKLWQYPAKKVCASWTQHFVPKITITDIIKNLTAQTSQTVGYNHSFYYPKQGGIQYFTSKLQNTLTNSIHTNHQATAINLQNKTVRFANGQQEQYDILISTIPLTELLQNLEEPSSLNLAKHHTHLLCNAVINFNLGYRLKKETAMHWVYMPEKKYPFYRVGFWHTIAPSLAPEGHGALYGELSYLPQKTTLKEMDSLVRQSITQARTLFDINDIVTEKILHLPHAYVIYNTWREAHLTSIHQRLSEYGIYSIGRYGAWKYASMQDAILDGKQVVTHLVTKNFMPATKDQEYKVLLQKPYKKPQHHTEH